jgi:uncharacterized protein (TIGR00251 family)
MSAVETKDGATLTIFVKPNSPKFRIQVDGGEVVVYSTEEPVKGKVNKEIVKEAGKLLGFRVEIVSGLTSKQKVLFFKGVSKAEVESVLGRFGKH